MCKYTKKIFIYCLLLILLPQQVLADTTQAKLLTLKEAVLLSLRYNPNIKSAELDRIVDKFRLRVEQNAFELRYALEGSASYTESVQGGVPSATQSHSLTPSISRQTTLGTKYTVTANNNINGSYYNPGVSLKVEQPLLRGSGKDVVTANLQTAYNDERLRKLALKETITENVATVINSYRKLVSDYNNLTIKKLALKTSQETVKQNEARIKAGSMAPAENIQAAAQIARQQLAVAEAENTIAQDRLNLLSVIGLPADTAITVPTEVSIEGANFPALEESRKLIFANNINYQNQLISYENDKLQLLKAKDNQRWELNLEADVVQGNGTGGDMNSSFRSISNGKNSSRDVKLALSVPIDDLSRQETLVQAKVSIQKDKINIASLKLDLESQVLSSIHTLETERQQITLAEQSEQLAQKNVDIAYKKLKYGQISMFEVNSLQSDLTNAKLEVLNNKIAYLNDINEFQKKIGIVLDQWGISIRY